MKQIALNLATLFLVLCVGTAAAVAQEESSAATSSVDYSFGQELRFNLHIDDAAGVERLKLYFRPELSSNVYEVEVPFEAGEVISVTQPVAVNVLDIRPYSNVSYFWEVQSADGVETVPERSFTYEDDRFPWQAMVRNGATAHWSGASPQLGQSVLDTTDRSLSELMQLIPLEEVDPIDIYIYPSTADIRAALRLAGLEDNEFDQRELGVLLLASVNEETAVSDLEHILPYELAHLLLYRAAGQQVSGIPWWLREGIAESARINDNPRDEELLAEALTFNDTIPLWRLCDAPEGSAERQELATVQSASLVRYLVENRPTGTIPDLLIATISGDNCEQGVRRVLSESLDELEEEWLASLQQPSSLQTMISEAVPWLLLLIGGTLLILIVIVANRQKE